MFLQKQTPTYTHEADIFLPTSSSSSKASSIQLMSLTVCLFPMNNYVYSHFSSVESYTNGQTNDLSKALEFNGPAFSFCYFSED